MNKVVQLKTYERVGYDYSEITSNVAAELQAVADTIRSINQQYMRQIGLQLLSVKDHLPHGKFRDWILKETQLSVMTATRYMQIAENLDEEMYQRVVHLKPTTIYALASPSTPDEVRQALAKTPVDQVVYASEVDDMIAELRKVEDKAQAKAERKAKREAEEAAKVDPKTIAKAERAEKREMAERAQGLKNRMEELRKAARATDMLMVALGSDLEEFRRLTEKGSSDAFLYVLKGRWRDRSHNSWIYEEAWLTLAIEQYEANPTDPVLIPEKEIYDSGYDRCSNLRELDKDAITTAMAAITDGRSHDQVMVFKGTRYIYGERQECYEIAKGEHVVIAYRNLHTTTVPCVILEV